MAILERLVRRSVSRYYPFSERRYRGAYPFGSSRRGFSLTTNTPFSRRLLVSQFVLPARKPLFSLYEDRRTYHPEGVYRPARSLTESYPQLTEVPSGPRKYNPVRKIDRDLVNTATGEILWHGVANPFKVGWENPWKMLICLKRAMRREVMHATGYAGKVGFKAPRYTQFSKVRCF